MGLSRLDTKMVQLLCSPSFLYLLSCQLGGSFLLRAIEIFVYPDNFPSAMEHLVRKASLFIEAKPDIWQNNEMPLWVNSDNNCNFSDYYCFSIYCSSVSWFLVCSWFSRLFHKFALHLCLNRSLKCIKEPQCKVKISASKITVYLPIKI